MNAFTRFLPLPIVGLLSVSSAADTDYSAIRKDINVMNKIVAVAIDSAGDCEKCRVSIKGSYLANQGAMFVVSPRRSSGFREMIIADGNYGIEGLEELEELESLEALQSLESLEELPEMIGEIMSDVGIAVGGISIDSTDLGDHEVHIAKHKIVRDESRDMERQMRSLQRKKMRLSEDLHDKEIEAMQAEESARNQLETAIRTMEAQISELEGEQQELRKQLSEARQERIREREKARAEAAARTAARNSRIENIILTAFCDYGASLKSLPEKEKVTILFENDGPQWSAEKSKIYVLGKSDLSACQTGKIKRDAMVADAIVYHF